MAGVVFRASPGVCVPAILESACSREGGMPGQEQMPSSCISPQPTAAVRFEHTFVPEQLPGGAFELILLSEVIYYLSRNDVGRLAARVTDSLAKGGSVILVHWTGPTEGRRPATGAPSRIRCRRHAGQAGRCRGGRCRSVAACAASASAFECSDLAVAAIATDGRGRSGYSAPIEPLSRSR
jgi:hypothetical protein